MSETVVQVGGTTYRRDASSGAWREDDHTQPEFSYGVPSGAWKFLDAIATARSNALREVRDALGDDGAQSLRNLTTKTRRPQSVLPATCARGVRRRAK